MADNTPEYPKRESHFAHKVVRKMIKSCVGNEYGNDVFAFLVVIAHTEDAAHYRRPINFFNEQLMPLAGIKSLSTLKRIREIAVKSGWLVYVPGVKRKPPLYWVTIPDHATGLNDNPTDEGENTRSDLNQHSENTRSPVNQNGNSGSLVNQNPGSMRAQCEPESGLNVAHLLPVPDPDPKETTTRVREKQKVPIPPELDTPEARTAWGRWLAFLEATIAELPFQSQEQCLRLWAPLGEHAFIEAIQFAIANNSGRLTQKPIKTRGGNYGRPRDNAVSGTGKRGL